MGSVFLCRDTLGARIQAAVKVNAMVSPEGRQRFMREVEALSAIEHPGIVALLSWGEDPERQLLWLAMENLEGENLEDRLERGAMPLDEAVEVFTLLARALQHAHAGGIFHRDVKPANIVLTDDGPRLVDFGIAFQQDRTRLTTENQVPGTVRYMPPELITASVAPDPHSSDIYALGTILCEALTGRPTIELPDGLSDGQRFAKVMASKLDASACDPGPGHPAHLRELVRRSTDPDPAARLDDWDHFLDLLEGRGAATRGSSRPWAVALGALGLAAMVAVGLLIIDRLAVPDEAPETATPERVEPPPEAPDPAVVTQAEPVPQPELVAEPAVEPQPEPTTVVEPSAPPVRDEPPPAVEVAAVEPPPDPVSDASTPVAGVGEVLITVNGTPRTVRVADLVLAARDGEDTRLNTTTGSFLCEETITDLDRAIADPAVLRVHRDFLVNAAHVTMVEDDFAVTSAGDVTVSPRYLEPLRAAAGL